MVPSSGSTTHRTPLVPAMSTPSSPRIPSSGRAPSSALGDQHLRGPVHLRHHVGARGLGADLGSRAGPAPSTQQPAGRPGGLLRQGAERVEVGRAVTGVTLGSGACPTPTAASTCAATPSPARRPRCDRPWPRPRSATTASVTTPPWPAWRRPSPSGSARRPRCSCRPAPWPTRSRCGSWARPGTVVLAGRRQHLVVREVAAAGANAAAQVVTLDDADGTVEPAELQRWVDDARVGWAAPSAVFVEDTHGEVGGRVWPLERLAAVAAVGLPVHLDGARLWNAAVASGTTVAERAAHATTVTCCVSKGLGAPVGSLLAGPVDLVRQARVERKRLGGGMRQVGILAAAGLIALERVDRLAEDHARARVLATCGRRPVARIRRRRARADQHRPHRDPRPSRAAAAPRPPRASSPCPGSSTSVRLVTHADVDDDDVDAHRRRAGVGAVIEATHAGAGAGRLRPPRRPRGGLRRHAGPVGDARLRGAPRDRQPRRQGQLRPDHRPGRAGRPPRRGGGASRGRAGPGRRRAPRAIPTATSRTTPPSDRASSRSSGDAVRTRSSPPTPRRSSSATATSTTATTGSSAGRCSTRWCRRRARSTCRRPAAPTRWAWCCSRARLEADAWVDIDAVLDQKVAAVVVPREPPRGGPGPGRPS